MAIAAYASEATRPVPRTRDSFTEGSTAAGVGHPGEHERADVRMPKVGVEVVAEGAGEGGVGRDYAGDRPRAAFLDEDRSARVSLADRAGRRRVGRLEGERADGGDRRRARAQRRQRADVVPA